MMNVKANLSLATILLLMSIIISFMVSLTKKSRDINRCLIANSDFYMAHKNDSILIDNLRNIDAWRLQNENTIIDSSIIIKDELGNNISIKKLIGNENKIVFRYTELNCMACVDQEIKNINQYLNTNIIDNHVIVLATYNSFSNLRNFKSTNKIDIKFYNIDNNVLKSDLAKKPYYFIIDNKLRITHLYSPAIISAKDNANYLHILESKLLDSTAN